MDLGQCPYCDMLGFIMTVKSIPGGIEVSGQCTVCGYSCDSDYAADETSTDPPPEVGIKVAD
jgi:hypothetical protein